ncbi:SphA family protein [Castellaniella caeni]|uniref:SphA family protein n=1 Tax=Castellaniella caeni TaxID=266123 RepID=UPI000830D664|nr:transporter [Castellaniella caeni]
MKLKTCATALTLALGLCLTAQAKEGADQYPNGAENWLAGAVPPPGSYFLNYAGYYSGKLRDGNGDKVGGASVDAWFDALRFIHITEHQILGGNWGWHIIAPLVHQRIRMGGGADTESSLGDITISPFILSWHRGSWHWVAALDVYAPTGDYHSGEPRRSIGANYWSFEPVFAATYLNAQGWEASAKFMYNMKTTNTSFSPVKGGPKMDYRSGDEFHADFLLGKHFGPWAVGVSGYYLQQTTNDELDGQAISPALGPWSEGRKGRVLAFGPSVNYTTKKGLQLTAQWQHETLVENRFGGDKFWLKLVMPL